MEDKSFYSSTFLERTVWKKAASNGRGYRGFQARRQNLHHQARARHCSFSESVHSGLCEGGPASLVVLVLLVVLVVDLEVAELVGVLGGGDDAQPVPQVVLLEVLLGEVLEVPLGKGHRRGQHDLVLLLGEGHVLAKVLRLARDLDALLEVRLEVAAVHDAVLDGVRAVDGEAQLALLRDLDAALALQLLAAGALLARLSAADLLLAGGLLGCGAAR